jgi:carbon storage regulator
MLVLTRKSNQSIMIGDDIEVSVLSIMGEKVRIGIQAPRDIPVFRKEVYLEIQQERNGAVEAPADGTNLRGEVDEALRKLGTAAE